MCCWNLAVNCQYNIRLTQSQTSTRSSFGSSTSFSTCSYPSSTPDDNDCGLSACRWRLGLRASSKTPTNHYCSRAFTFWRGCRSRKLNHRLTAGTGLNCSRAGMFIRTQYRLWILTWYEKDFLLHTWQIPTVEKHYFRPWLKHRITRKLLKIDRYMLRGVWQALNCLSIRATYCVIVAGASPGETKMWAAVGLRRNGIARPPCISWASCFTVQCDENASLPLI